MGTKRTLRALRAALEDEESVRLARSLRNTEALDGFVVGLDDDWVLLHRVRDVRLDGWSAVRLDTVESVERGGPDALASRVLRARSQRPVALDLDLTSAKTVIQTMADALPLVTLHREALPPDECVIGRPHRFTKRRIHLRDVTTDAEWEAAPYRLELADITRVDAGGDYETALALLAGDPPAILRDTQSIRAS